jgi:hypothetical protein
LAGVPELRSCIVSYQDLEGVTHSIEVTAETLYEAAVLGMQAMKGCALAGPAEFED